MKKLLSLALVMAMFLGLAVPAFAEAYPDPDVVYPGNEVRIYTDDFYWEDEDGDLIPLACELDKEYFAGVTPRWSKGGNYIDRVYFDDGDDYVTIVFKDDIDVSSEKDIIGSLRIRDSDAKRTYVCEIEEGDLILGVMEKVNMETDGDREFSLPWDYQTNKVKFVSEDGEDYGTFTANFNTDSGKKIAYFSTKIVEQSPLYLGYNQNANMTLVKKYSNANLRFITWSANPTFDITGKLGIYMEPEEFIYGVKDDNTLYRLGGTYDTKTGAYVISTATLGSYVISNKQLVTSGSSSGSGTSTSTPASSSSTAPAPSSSSSAAPAPSSSSSVAPAPSSSSAAPSSSEAASDSSASSEPDTDGSSSSESVAPSSSEVESSEPESEATDADAEEDKGGFPLVPVLIGVLVVVIVICVAVVVLGNRGGSGRGKKKKFDDWDD
jgi:hypothetical protein